jgi:hypothetical protein
MVVAAMLMAAMLALTPDPIKVGALCCSTHNTSMVDV